MKVIKPKLSMYAMCIYKFTLNTGFYYYGATTNLGDRIFTHLKKYRDKALPVALMDALEKATSIKFEFVRFVNDREYLKKEEEKYLRRHVGLPMCLNTDTYCSTAFKRGKGLYKIAKLTIGGDIIKIWETPTIAAKDLGMSMRNVDAATRIKYPKTKFALRKLNDNGEIMIPIKQIREYPSFRKPVNQYDKQMNFISTFESMEEAARKLGIDRKGISDVANGRQKTSKGFIFSLVNH